MERSTNSFVPKAIQSEGFAAIKQLGVYWRMVDEPPPPADHETAENWG
jgi:hypothetical protein